MPSSMPASLFKCSFRMRLESYSLTFLRAILHDRKSAHDKKKIHSFMSTSLQTFLLHTSSPWLITIHRMVSRAFREFEAFKILLDKEYYPPLRNHEPSFDNHCAIIECNYYPIDICLYLETYLHD